MLIYCDGVVDIRFCLVLRESCRQWRDQIT